MLVDDPASAVVVPGQHGQVTVEASQHPAELRLYCDWHKPP